MRKFSVAFLFLAFSVSVAHADGPQLDSNGNPIGTPMQAGPPGNFNKKVEQVDPTAAEKKRPPASIYYYKDAEGGMHAVDSIDDVPVKFRAKAKAMPRKK